MEKLAKLTQVSNLGELIQDALRIYEWVVYEQSEQRPVVSMPIQLLLELQSRPETINSLPLLFENLGAVKEYFKAA